MNAISRLTKLFSCASAITFLTVGVSAAQQENDISQEYGTVLEEVIVTAEKREERSLDTPIAITAVSGLTLEKSVVRQVSDLVLLAPSLQFGTRSTNVFIAIRGIGQAGQDIGSQSGVTVSLDGVPLLNHFMMNPVFLDVDRVEVLRGPQGTFQGRNATGGAINVYSKSPTNELDAEVYVTAGNYSRIGAWGFVNVPFSDKVSGRLSFQSVRADGWMENGYLNRDNDDTNLDQVRGQLLIEPSDTFSIEALIEYTRDRANPSFNTMLGRAVPDIPTAVELPGYPYPQNDIDNLTFYENRTNQRDVKDWRATLTANWELGSDSALTSITGYIDHDIDLTDLDIDLTPYDVSSFPLIGIYAKQLTQEFTYTTDFGTRADFVAGFFYMHGESSEPLYLDYEPIKNYLIYLPSEDLDSYAAYAQFRYNLTDKFRMTIGGRYTIDDKAYKMDATVLTYHTVLTDDNSWGAFTPRFVLDYTPNDNSLIYASASRGFKSGGFNTLGDITQEVNRFNPEYVWSYEIGAKAMLFDQKLRLELTGFYSDYTNLQQTVFRINEATQVRFPKVANSSSATIKGIEFEVQGTPAAGLLITGAVTYLDAKFGKFCNNDPLYPLAPTDPDCIGEEDVPPGAINLQGNALPQSPKWQFVASAQYSFPISDKLVMTPRVDYKWQSSTEFDIYNNPLNSQDNYGLLNSSITVATSDQAWSLMGWIRNAFDERFISQGNTSPGVYPNRSGTVGFPRTYGVTLYHRF